MVKQLSNSGIAKYRDLSVSCRSIMCLNLRLRQIIDRLATDKSRYFAQPRPIIVNYFSQYKQDTNVPRFINFTLCKVITIFREEATSALAGFGVRGSAGGLVEPPELKNKNKRETS